MLSKSLPDVDLPEKSTVCCGCWVIRWLALPIRNTFATLTSVVYDLRRLSRSDGVFWFWLNNLAEAPTIVGELPLSGLSKNILNPFVHRWISPLGTRADDVIKRAQIK